ncbi:hypothetical protein SK803_22845 [Lentzea sp. BCCO 10_0856]|uniref:DUF4136 domain-containing protein n=1 Tax=Lentzea miocenica TaxID=3095431 RepID=A0ABU4T4H2_9PSEU|nr:hypothetical protein [Lentzea sp. BCCO 10_0856]MDX8033065.1 hypothetical protein [Lentzea sp. BCCO 10_0856]
MLRSLALFVSAAMLLTACSTPRPVAAPKIAPPAPAIGPQADCAELIGMEDTRCLGWAAPEPHGFFDVRRINNDEAGTGKELEWGPYYWCAALNDDVVKNAMGSTDVARVVTDKFYCQIVVRGHKSSGIYNSLYVYLSPYRPGNPAFDWFVEPNELGEVTEYKGRKAVRNDKLSYDTSDRIQYTVEIPGQGSVWNLEMQRSQFNPRLPFTSDLADAERRVRVVIDALMAYDQT